MAEKCGKCEKDITKDGLKCTDCEVSFHVQCTSAAVGDPAKKIGTRRTWKCEGCASECSSSSSKAGAERETGNSSVLKAITAFRKESNERWDETLAKLNKVQEDIKEVTAEMSLMKKQLKEVETKSTKTCQTVESLKEENIRLNSEMAGLQREVRDLQQHTRKSNVLITGVPVTPKEDVYDIIQNIARLLDLQYYRNDISVAHRLPSRQGDDRPPSIVVSFVSRSVKSDWITARRAKKTLSARELRATFADHQIYVNEHLTTETRALFNGARALVKTGKLASVWTSDCRVMAKRTPTGRPFSVKHLHHLVVPDHPSPAETP